MIMSDLKDDDLDDFPDFGWGPVGPPPQEDPCTLCGGEMRVLEAFATCERVACSNCGLETARIPKTYRLREQEVAFEPLPRTPIMPYIYIDVDHSWDWAPLNKPFWASWNCPFCDSPLTTIRESPDLRVVKCEGGCWACTLCTGVFKFGETCPVCMEIARDDAQQAKEEGRLH
jgi:hypothetical protein